MMLTFALDLAEVADPSLHHSNEQIFFGATVSYATAKGEERTITIKGIDESDSLAGEVSWVSPIARVLLKARVGDELQLMTLGGVEQIEVIEVSYPKPEASKPYGLTRQTRSTAGERLSVRSTSARCRRSRTDRMRFISAVSRCCISSLIRM